MNRNIPTLFGKDTVAVSTRKSPGEIEREKSTSAFPQQSDIVRSGQAEARLGLNSV